MLRSLLSNPLLLREMFSGVKGNVPGRATYPGPTVTLCACLFVAVLYWFFGNSHNAFFCSRWFLFAAFLQTWIWFYRSGAYAASAIAGKDEDGSLAIIATTPYSVEQALLAKMVGALAPLGVEVLLVACFNCVVFGLSGTAPWILLLSVTGFQAGMIAGGAGLGLLFGRRLGDSAKAVHTFHKLAVFVGLTGVCMMVSTMAGHVAVVAFFLYLLLSLIPTLFEKFRLWTGTVALGLIILMPFSLMFNLGNLYNGAQSANPYVALCRTAPIDCTRADTYRSGAPVQDFYPFANYFFCRCTGAEKLANNSFWLSRFCSLIEYNPQLGTIVNSEYLRWRVRKLSMFAWVGLVLLGVSAVGVEYSVKRQLSNN